MTPALERALRCLMAETGDGGHVSPGYFGDALYGVGRPGRFTRKRWVRPGTNALRRLEAEGFAERSLTSWALNRYRITDEGRRAVAELVARASSSGGSA